MKKASLTIVLIVFATFLLASHDKGKKTGNKTESAKESIMYFPYSKKESIQMELIHSKNEYTLWRCQGKLVDNYPGKSITGKEYNYFVYKNGEFHLTVNNYNKNDIYNYFIN
ncbi:MAG: hypothetical protein JXR36_17350 [Bacteroidales bacterium]|nr:hypothetical protein [Bacteroidales bacterium]